MSNFHFLDKPYDFKAKRCVIASIDGATARTKKALLQQIAAQLRFPDYFGENMDALFDMLTDLSWLKEKNVHLIFQHYDQLLSDEPQELKHDILALLHESAEEWKGKKGKQKRSLAFFGEVTSTLKQDLAEAGLLEGD